VIRPGRRLTANPRNFSLIATATAARAKPAPLPAAAARAPSRSAQAWRTPWASAWVSASWRRRAPASGRPRAHRRQLDKHRIGHQPRRRAFAFAGGVAAAVGRRHDADRHVLRLIARKREAHGEFVGRHRERAGCAAGLAERGLGLGAGRLGFELHGGRRRCALGQIELHPARQTRTCGEAEAAGCNCDDPFHGQSHSGGPKAAFTHTRSGG